MKNNFLKRISILFLSPLATSVAFGSRNPKGFIEIEPFGPDTPEMRCANYSQENWLVENSEGKLKISEKAHESKQVKKELKLAGGTFVGFNRGEWGGGLEFQSSGGTEKIPVTDNIFSLFLLPQEKIAAFTGMYHMGTDEGFLVILSSQSASPHWKIEQTIKLPVAPLATVQKDPQTFLIAASDGLYSVSLESGAITAIRKAAFWNLYPNSVALTADGTVYVGMRYAVAKIWKTKTGYALKWLVKHRCVGVKDMQSVYE